MSNLIQTVEPVAEPVTLSEARAWLRVDATNEDPLIQRLISAGRAAAENFTRRALIAQQFEMALDEFPDGCRQLWGRLRGQNLSGSRQIVFPKPPLQSVQSIKYVDASGVEQTFSPAGYHVDTRSQPGRIVLHEDYDWPETANQPNAVIIAYTAGYGSQARVPQGIKTAILYYVTHWFENRAHVNIGNIVNPLPDTVEALLWQYRIPSAY